MFAYFLQWFMDSVVDAQMWTGWHRDSETNTFYFSNNINYHFITCAEEKMKHEIQYGAQA